MDGAGGMAGVGGVGVGQKIDGETLIRPGNPLIPTSGLRHWTTESEKKGEEWKGVGDGGV